ncbi:MAG TPA: adenosylcobalamin-dependent ribonucleoside-diphosphate reductase [Candidatus Nanoarchaeia archaeon]|nr:adenosylcobalamin-dependent ribonucleoside-diphosphate reductase [Candidatus Nanoarchaeia archaeon]
MKLTKNARIVMRRFLKKDESGKIIESPEDLLRRVAKNIAKEDIKYNGDVKNTEKEFFKIMNNQEFLPNLPAIANAGRELQQLAACFVIPVGDSMEEIFQAVKDMALIQKSGGGTGFSFSRLRPEGSPVKETGGVASGPVSFMKVFDAATGAIKEGGIRRGANMGILRVDHPEIEKFISSKSKGELTNFNISIALTDRFINAVKTDSVFDLKFNNKVYKKMKARRLFSLITKNAWINGDPGIIFIDQINKHNPTPKIGEIEATNPCGEQPLLPYESCILGSINLTKFFENREINYNKLESVIKTSVHFLDNSIDATSYPTSNTEKIVKANRKIGLGVMGFADLLILFRVRYDSNKSLKLAEKIMKFIQEKAKEASKEIAEKRGSFPNIENSIYKGKKMRNATATTIAPTGTIAIFADCSEGIEPLFNLIFKRNSTYGILYEINPLFRKIAKKYKLTQSTINRISSEGTLKNIDLPPEIKNLFRTAHDISPEWHVKIQSAFQGYTDNAVSKTVNLPENASIKDIQKVYLLAHKLNCKGLTVYRYNSRKKQILELCKKCQKI